MNRNRRNPHSLSVIQEENEAGYSVRQSYVVSRFDSSSTILKQSQILKEERTEAIMKRMGARLSTKKRTYSQMKEGYPPEPVIKEKILRVNVEGNKQCHPSYSVKRFEREEKQLRTIAEEVSEYKEAHRKWKQFYEKRIKNPSIFEQIPQKRSKTPTTVIRPFNFHLDQRFSMRKERASSQSNSRIFSAKSSRNVSAKRVMPCLAKVVSQNQLPIYQRRRSRSFGEIAVKSFRLLTQERANFRNSVLQHNSTSRLEESSKKRFKARKMPDFTHHFRPMINDKEITMPIEFNLRTSKRKEMRSSLMEQDLQGPSGISGMNMGQGAFSKKRTRASNNSSPQYRIPL